MVFVGVRVSVLDGITDGCEVNVAVFNDKSGDCCVTSISLVPHNGEQEVIVTSPTIIVSPKGIFLFRQGSHFTMSDYTPGQ